MTKETDQERYKTDVVKHAKRGLAEARAERAREIFKKFSGKCVALIQYIVMQAKLTFYSFQL